MATSITELINGYKSTIKLNNTDNNRAILR